MFGHSIRYSHSMISLLFIVTAGVVSSTPMTVMFEDEGFSEGISLMQVGTQRKSVPMGASNLELEVNVSHPGAGELPPVSLLHIPYNHISMNVTYNSVVEEMTTFPQRRPREFNVILATVKTWLADFVVQFISKPAGSSFRLDFRRSFAFAIFGFCYVGVLQWFLYVTLLTWIFPDAMIFANSPWSMKLADGDGQLDMLGQILFDNAIINVFIYFPAFYCIKSIVQGSGSPCQRIKDVHAKYSKNMWQDNMASCMLWIPADFIVFACPMYLRMPLEHGVSFGWTMFMSLTRGSISAASKEADKTNNAKAEVA